MSVNMNIWLWAKKAIKFMKYISFSKIIIHKFNWCTFTFVKKVMCYTDGIHSHRSNRECTVEIPFFHAYDFCGTILNISTIALKFLQSLCFIFRISTDW